MRVFLFFMSIVVAAAFLSMGCATKAVWDKKYESVDYNETIEAFMKSNEDSKIVFLGRTCHYIFSKNEGLDYLLANRDKDEIVFDVAKGRYVVNENRANASFYVRIKPKKDDTELLKWITANKAQYDKATDTYSYFVALSGERYAPDQKINNLASKFGRSIMITVKEKRAISDGVGTTTGKLAITPLTAAIDGAAILIGAVVLIPIFVMTSGR